MKRVELKRLISEIIRRKLAEQDAVASTSTEEAPVAVDPQKAREADNLRKKLERAKAEQAKALELKRKADEEAAKFEKRNYAITNNIKRKSTQANIKVGQASKKVSAAQEELQGIQDT